MRYGLAAIFIYMIGLVSASALPAGNAHKISVSKAGPVVQVAKRAHPPAHRRARADNGIHPLVGSGNY